MLISHARHAPIMPQDHKLDDLDGFLHVDLPSPEESY